MAADNQAHLAEALEVLLALTACVEDGDHNGADRFILVPKSALEDARKAALGIKADAGL